MLDAFARAASDETRQALFGAVMPFANLTASGGQKRHGLRGARAPRTAGATNAQDG